MVWGRRVDCLCVSVSVCCVEVRLPDTLCHEGNPLCYVLRVMSRVDPCAFTLQVRKISQQMIGRTDPLRRPASLKANREMRFSIFFPFMLFACRCFFKVKTKQPKTLMRPCASPVTAGSPEVLSLQSEIQHSGGSQRASS